MGKTKSIVTDDMKHCLVCGSTRVEVHHILFGRANRKWSDKFGLVIALCPEHHRGSTYSPHFNRDFDLQLKRMAQQKFEETHPDLDFRKIFGKNYI